MSFTVVIYEKYPNNDQVPHWMLKIKYGKKLNKSLSFGEPCLFNNDDLDGLIEGKSGLSGGGNSNWTLYRNKKSDDYSLEIDISGSGEDLYTSVVLSNTLVTEIVEIIKEVNISLNNNSAYQTTRSNVTIKYTSINSK